MSEVKVPIEIENAFDRRRQILSEISEQDVRKVSLKALADTGSTMMVLPQEVVEKLGLRETGKVIVTYADERKEERPRAGIITVKVEDRQTSMECVVGPPASEPLLGHMVLEAMDLFVDCVAQKLVPRPESPFLPLLKMKKLV